MKLNEEQKNVVITKLSNFFRTSCIICNGSEWLLNDTIYELREFMGGSFILGEKVSIFPVLAVSCKSCGHTHYFNAILIGVVKK
ncbi:MAG: hypothetical protein Q8N37_04480 [bacterium]|nr:hypothetical protein [bacterium]